LSISAIVRKFLRLLLLRPALSRFLRCGLNQEGHSGESLAERERRPPSHNAGHWVVGQSRGASRSRGDGRCSSRPGWAQTPLPSGRCLRPKCCRVFISEASWRAHPGTVQVGQGIQRRSRPQRGPLGILDPTTCARWRSPTRRTVRRVSE